MRICPLFLLLRIYVNLLINNILSKTKNGKLVQINIPNEIELKQLSMLESADDTYFQKKFGIHQTSFINT